MLHHLLSTPRVLLQKVVIKVYIHDDEDKRKVLKKASSLSGVESFSINMKYKFLILIGENIDAVNVVHKLRKKWQTELVSVAQVKKYDKIDDKKKYEDTGLMEMEEYFNFLEIPIEHIKLATNNFSDENQITQSPTSSSKLYKGQLLKPSGESINIVVRKSSLPLLAWNEVYMSRYNHKNIISTYKLSEMKDGDELVIVNKDEASERLDRHLSGSALTWIQRLKICVGVADALSYLHFDAEVNHSVIHSDIKSSNILLDRNWGPKLTGFRYAVRTKKHNLQLINKYNGALQYMDPAYEKTKGLTHKSDVFSFGVVLFEVLFGREASFSISDEDNWGFVRLARLQYEKKTLDVSMR